MTNPHVIFGPGPNPPVIWQPTNLGCRNPSLPFPLCRPFPTSRLVTTAPCPFLAIQCLRHARLLPVHSTYAASPPPVFPLHHTRLLPVLSTTYVVARLDYRRHNPGLEEAREIGGTLDAFFHSAGPPLRPSAAALHTSSRVVSWSSSPTNFRRFRSSSPRMSRSARTPPRSTIKLRSPSKSLSPCYHPPPRHCPCPGVSPPSRSTHMWVFPFPSVHLLDLRFLEFCRL
jgi:hypothetical protein